MKEKPEPSGWGGRIKHKATFSVIVLVGMWRLTWGQGMSLEKEPKAQMISLRVPWSPSGVDLKWRLRREGLWGLAAHPQEKYRGVRSRFWSATC